MSSANESNAWMGYIHSATPEPSGTGSNGAQNDRMPQNSFMPVNLQPQQSYPAQAAQGSQQQQQQGASTQPPTVPVRRRGPGIIGRGMLPLSDDLPVQEYERRRKHNSQQAEENKKVQRERNNEAARRSRQRRADCIEDQKSEIARLKEENGALTRERDYWKGIVDRMQSNVMSGGMGRVQQPMQSTLPTPSRLPSQLMRPFPDMGSASAQAQGAALAAASVNNNLNTPPVSQALAPAAFEAAALGHANHNLADFNLLPVSDAPDNGLGNSEFFQQMEEFEASLKKGNSADALENFDFSI
ncbi:hypothetical protein PG984_008863 [Apiospora sp. TS-2023a]